MQKAYKSIESHSELSISYCRKVIFAIVALVVIIFIIYGNSFDCSWHFDDKPNITDNPNLHLKEITRENIKRTIFSDRNNPHVLYRPIACLSFGLNHYFSGLDVFGYHLVNIFIHLISSIFLFLFVYHTLNLPSLKTKYTRHSYSIALLASILWAINPIQTQAVTYIVQRMASLAGMFYIMGMYFYLKARTTETGYKKVLFFIVCLVSFVMALGSKENAAMLPLSIFIYEILLLQEITGKNIRKNLNVFFIVTGAILILGFTYLYIQDGNIFSFLNGYENRPFTLAQRLLTESRIIIFYISLLLYPMPNRLNIAHSFQTSTSLFDPISTVLSILFVAGAISYAIYSAKKQPLFSFCILFFFLNHLIESTFFPLELIFEHRNYIPSMLFFVPFAIGLLALIGQYKKKEMMHYALAAFITLLLMGFGHATYLRNFDWKTGKTLWSDAVQKSPDASRPYHNLGWSDGNSGHFKKAVKLYEKALQKTITNRNDEFFATYFNLGQDWGNLRNYAQAEFFLKKAIHMKPSFYPVHNSLASIYDKQGKYELAYQHLLKSYDLFPQHPISNLNLGLHYIREQRPKKAIQHLKLGLNAKQFRARAVLYLAIAHKQMKHLGRAAVLLQEAIKEKPQDIKLYLHLAEVYLKAGHEIRAMDEAKKAVSLIPNTDIFQKILKDILTTDHNRNLQPDADIVIPLLREAFVRKATALHEWNELLKEAN